MTFGGILEALGGRLGVEIENAGGASAVEIDGTVVVLQDAGEFLLLRAEIGEPRGEGRSRAPTNWESRLSGGAFPPRPN